jgi:RNA polymerase sigma-70 factor (ECF subfamily)
VLVLRVFQDLSYDEIAETLQISPGTVMSRLFRARERLARSLVPYLGAAAVRRKGGAA